MSIRRELLAYRRERLPAVETLALAVFLTLCGLAADTQTPAQRLPAALPMAVLLVVGLRIWDDLADLSRDRIDYPQRVLSRVDNLWPFRGLAIVFLSVAAGFGLVSGPVERVWLLSGLIGALGVWYLIDQFLRSGLLFRTHVVLMKYPATVLILGSPDGRWVAGAVYLCVCVFDQLDDPRFETGDRMPVFVVLEVGLGGVLALVRCLQLAEGGWEPAVVVHLIVSILAVLITGWLVRRKLSLRAAPGDGVDEATSGRLHYAVFFVALAWAASDRFAAAAMIKPLAFFKES